MAAVAGLLLCLAKPVSAGIVTITMIENGGSISVTLSGSLDFSLNSGSNSTGGYSNFIGPQNGTLGLGASATLTQQWLISTSLAVQSASPVQSQSGVYFSPYGLGGFVENKISGYSGSALFIFTSGLGVDRSYVSGQALSGTGTISGDFASNGVTVGTSTTQFTLGTSANTLIVQRSVGVPDEMPTAVVGIGLLLLGLASRQRRV
jgi:hypothetical protein